MSTYELLLSCWLSLTKELGKLSPGMWQSLKPGIAAFMVSSLLGGAPLAADRNESCYRIDEAGVTYYREQFDPQFKRKHVTTRPMPEADPASFVDLEGFDCLCCAKDRDHVFWQNRVVPGAVPETFRYLGGGYADDGRQIFFRGRTVREADQATFEVYAFEDDRQPFVDAHDRRWIYLRGLPLRDLTAKPDAASLVAVDRFFFRDDRAVYRVHKARQSRDNDLLPLPEADPGMFRLLSPDQGSFARDGERVFLYYKAGRRFRIVEPADVESFEVLNLHYARDSERAYFQGESLPGADLATFEAVDRSRARDRFRSYDVRGKPSSRRGEAR